MDDALEKKIIADLEDSGFGSEMRTIRTFLNRGWSAKGSPSFYDLDDDVTREFDVSTHRVAGRELGESGSVTVFTMLALAVRRSKRPWVVFGRRPEHEALLGEGWRNLTYWEHLPQLSDHIVWELDGPLHDIAWRGTAIHESFKKPQDRSAWYPAFVSACKAAEHVLNSESGGTGPHVVSIEDAKKEPGHFVYVRPVVVVDAPLVLAQIVEGNIVVEDIPWAPFQFDFRTRNYARGDYFVDVVTLPSLDAYVEQWEARQEALLDALVGLLTQ